MHINARTANLLGAAALSLTDLMLAGATATAEVSTSGAAALVVLSAVPSLTVTELAAQVGLSVSPCHRRLRALERSGAIRGYRAVVDAEAVGLGFEARAGAAPAAAEVAIDCFLGIMSELSV